MIVHKLLLFCFIATLPVLAQTATADLSGNVTDSTGAAVANAKITATNPATGFSREVSTNQSGAYVFTILQPGVYNLAAEAPGFRTPAQTNIAVRVNPRPAAH